MRRPKVHDESRTLGSDRTELGALLVQAGLCVGIGIVSDLDSSWRISPSIASDPIT